MDNQNLKFLEETFFHTQNLCMWCLNKELKLNYSNCPEEKFFFNIFSIGNCPSVILTFFESSKLPLLITDDIGFVWACIYCVSDENEDLIYLLGPMFTSEMTSSYLYRRLRKIHLSQTILDRVMHYLADTPTINPYTASSYATMIYYCLNHVAIKISDVVILHANTKSELDDTWGGANWHGTWLEEQRMFKNIMEGRVEEQRNISAGVIGKMSTGDTLRQAKNEIIVYLVLCSRAAILGGVSYEGALNLSDYFMQAIENSETVEQAYSIGNQIQQTYISRVQEAKKNRKFSFAVQSCLEYIETHILEKIYLQDIAKSIGYTEYYISRIFKEEMQESMSNYINRRKVEISKTYLKYSTYSIAEISEYLGFSSSSYFISNFKKYVGMSPTEFRTNK